MLQQWRVRALLAGFLFNQLGEFERYRKREVAECRARRNLARDLIELDLELRASFFADRLAQRCLKFEKGHGR